MSSLSTQVDWEENIALWGPTSAGKSWMIRALCKELAWYNQHDPEFNYRVIDHNNQPISINPPTRADILPTDSAVDRIIHFHREGKKKTPRHIISAQTHRINIHDNRGLNLVEALRSPGQDRIVDTTLEDSPYVIAVLDPTTFLGKTTHSASSSSTPSASLPGALVTVPEYLDSVHALCHFLSSTSAGDKNKYLAICINKADSFALKSPPWQLIRMLFGREMFDLLEGFRGRLKINAFATSSVGYYWDRGIQKANANALGEIVRPDQWKPCNVVAPFFWIFENKERDRLQRRGGLLGQSLEDYIPYPPIRPC